MKKIQLEKREYVWEQPGDYFQECHASSCVRDESGNLMVVYFAGSKEGAPDVGIWMSRRINGSWEAPVRIKYEYGMPHWNPILHRDGDRILLYYKAGPSPREWWTLVSETLDFGERWTDGAAVDANSEAETVENRDIGIGASVLQIATKNRILAASDGRWFAGSSTESMDYLWDSAVEISADRGKSWTVHPIHFLHEADRPENCTEADGVIQPALWQSSENRFHCLMRSTRGYVYRSDSRDGGKTWCAAYPISLPNNNSGISLAQLPERECDNPGAGDLLLACNPVSDNWGARTPLSLAVSHDNGENWEKICDLETDLKYAGKAGAGQMTEKNAEFSYPYLAEDGERIDLVYTWNRKNIVHCEIVLL